MLQEMAKPELLTIEHQPTSDVVAAEEDEAKPLAEPEEWPA